MVSPQIGNNPLVFAQSCYVIFDVQLYLYRMPIAQLNMPMANKDPSIYSIRSDRYQVVAKMVYSSNVFAVALSTQAAIVQYNILFYIFVHFAQYEDTPKMILDRKSSAEVFQAEIFPMHLKLNTHIHTILTWLNVSLTSI